MAKQTTKPSDKKPATKKTVAKKKPATKKALVKKKPLTKAQKEKERLKKIEQVIDLIESGLSLRKALKMSKVGKCTFYDWLDEEKKVNGEFAKVNKERYARACDERAEAIMDEIYDICDENTSDTITRYDKNGEPYDVENSEWVNRSKLKVDARKWHLAKLRPNKYGEKVQEKENIDITISFK